jgi:hypothetical protein
MKGKIDMEALKEFNPKLYGEIEKDPQNLLKFQEVLFAHEKHAEVAAA